MKLLDAAGLVFHEDNEPLFCRENTLRLWDTLSRWSAPARDGLSVVGHVRGPPGTGKSTTTFAWLQAQVDSTGKSSTWFHVDSSSLVHCVEFIKKKNGGVSYTEPKQEVIKKLGGLIKKCTSTILVLDGVKSSDIFKNILSPAVRIWAGEKQGARTAVLIASGAFPEPRLEDAVSKTTRMDSVNIWSWTREEYIRAFKRARPNSNFGKRVSKKRRVEATPGDAAAMANEASENGAVAAEDNALDDDLLEDIDDKYFYAGGCARYFFLFSTQQVKKEISNAVNTLKKTDIAEVLSTGSGHEENRHRLVSFFQSDENDEIRKSIVSQFAVQKLVEHAGEEAFIFLYGIGGTNPSFDGWVFEADFFFQYKRAAETGKKLKLNGEPDLEIKPELVVEFDHDAMLEKANPLNMSCTKPLSKSTEEELKQELQSDLKKRVEKMCKPTKWNQGGYDGFYVSVDPENEKDLIIWFFQVTRGASHKLNLKYFVEVVQLFIHAELNVSGCEIYFVVPEGGETQVSGVTPYGTLFQERFKWAKGKEKEAIRIVRLNKTNSVGSPISL